MPGAEDDNDAASATIAEDIKSCAQCGSTNPDLKRCVACKSAFYCGTTCQRSNRKAHKKECKRQAFELDVELAKSKRPECPLCTYILPVTNDGCTYMVCCGKHTCHACMIEHCIAHARADKDCPFCRTPLPRSGVEASKKLLARIEKGDTNAMQNLSFCYINGNAYPYHDIEKDEKKGIELLQRAVDLGSADACFFMGNIYIDGLQVPRDYDKAEQLLTQSAKAGSAEGAYLLSKFYVKVRPNISKFVYYLRLSAAMGYELAMTALAGEYTKSENLKVLKKDEFEATLRSFQATQDDMNSEARKKWGKESTISLTTAGYSWETLELYQKGVISSLPSTKKGVNV